MAPAYYVIIKPPSSRLMPNGEWEIVVGVKKKRDVMSIIFLQQIIGS